jgi:hypothetical protein
MLILKYIVAGTVFLWCVVCSQYGQATTPKDSVQAKFSWSAYTELYYVYDFGRPANHERPDFLYSHKRHNEINLNLGYLRAAYQTDRVRARLALMAGTYTQYNMAAEQGLLKHIYEASAGIKVLAKADLWLEAGVFPSHIGFESAESSVCPTLTRSMMAENTPYYEAGAKLTYTTSNTRWLFSALVLNGWQRISRIPGNQSPALGTQIQFKPSSKVTLNSSTFLGNDKPDSVRQNRLFHNLYGIFQVGKKWQLIAAFDTGLEETFKGSNTYYTWYNPEVILRYQWAPRWAAAARIEYYEDKHEVIIATGTANGFQTLGYSLNLDFNPFEQVLWRIEGRVLESKDAVFSRDGLPAHQNFMLATSIAVSF